MHEPQVMVLTGCAGGIGRQLAGMLAAAGHRLYLTDVNTVALETLAREHQWDCQRIQLRPLDVRDSAAWGALLDEVIAHWGRIDVVWNIAGCIAPGYVHVVGPEMVDWHLDVNAKGAIYGSQAAAARMVRQGHGHIVNIASMAAIAPVAGIALYTASKFALRGFSLALDHELRPHGVAVTVVCPDAVQTPMLDLQLDYPEAALTFSGPRTLSAEEVAEVIVTKVLPKRPVEVIMPRWRGWLAKLASAWPDLARILAPRLTRQGLARQSAAKSRRAVRSAPLADG